MKTLNVEEETHEKLKEIGSYGDTMDDIIRKLINHYRKDETEGENREG